MNYRLLPALVTLLGLTGVAPTAAASFPVGVWGLVEKVTLDDPDKPTTMRIDGVFMVANQKPDFPQYPGYSAPQYGFIHYVCLDKQLATCAMEWKELQALAGGDDNCRGWGDNTFEVNGTVHPPGEPSEEQDVYPVSMGVVTGITPCQALAAWQLENPDPDTDGSTGEPGSTGGTGATGEPATGGETGSTTTSGPPATTSGEPATTSGAPETGDVTSSGGTAEPFTSGSPTEGASAGTTGAATSASETTANDGGQDKDSGCACDGRADANTPTLGALALLAGLALTRRRRAA